MLSRRSFAWLALGAVEAMAVVFRAEAALAFSIGLAGGLSLAGSV
jgi:hypothetical protein